jgi:hypothetical protein
MKTVEAEGIVTPDGQLSVRIPFAVSPGKHRVVVVIDERPIPPSDRARDEFPVIDVGAWPEQLSLRRQDLYDDSER